MCIRDSNVTIVLNTMSVEHIEWCLRVPQSVKSKIGEQSHSEEGRRNQLVNYWLRTSPYASWQWLSGWIYYYEEKSALSAVKTYVQRAPGVGHMMSCTVCIVM